MRKTTRGRKIRHIVTERISGFIVKAESCRIKVGEYMEVETPKPVDGKRNWDKATNEAYERAVSFSNSAVNPITKRPLDCIIIGKIMKTSRPIKLR